MYVVCIEHIERHLDQMTLSICQKMRATQVCTLKESFEEKYYDEYPSCFFFYQEDLITLYDFCLPCQLYFAALPEFKLKKIVIAGHVEHCL